MSELNQSNQFSNSGRTPGVSGAPGSLPPVAPGCTRWICTIAFRDKQAGQIVVDAPNPHVALAAVSVAVAQQGNKSGIAAIQLLPQTGLIIQPN